MTGFPPFRGESILAILNRQYSRDASMSPELLNPDISPSLSAVILKSIAKDPNARFSSASALTIALAEALNVPVPPALWKAQLGNLAPHGDTPCPSSRHLQSAFPSDSLCHR